jgi:adenosylmethionine---8-amino-7-oxononanoate aminotransferase
MTLTRSEIISFDKQRIWHPYTAMDTYIEQVQPLVIERAQGARLFDNNGKSYLDANSSWWVSSLGHNHPRLVRALKHQADHLCHCSLAGITHAPAAELAHELIQIAPSGLERVFFSDDGSTAVECAVKMAAQYWQQHGFPHKKRFLALESGFHGETVGAASLGGVEVFRRPFAGLLFDCVHVPFPKDESSFQQAFEQLGEIIKQQSHNFAALIVEPLVQGAAGMRFYNAEHLQALVTLCQENNVLVIADEVFTGYGRTGAMWASDLAGIKPDILCTAKGFTGGVLPMAATLTTQTVFDAFRGDRTRAFYYGHSYCGNPLAAAVALEVLRVFEEERILESIPIRTTMIADCFTQLERLDGASNARSLGMIGAIDLHETLDEFAQTDEAGYLSDIGWQVHAHAESLGAYLRPLGNVIYVCPPLNIPIEDLQELLEIVTKSVTHILASQRS